MFDVARTAHAAGNDTIRIGPDTERWERAILELEMRYYDDPRFLGVGGLMLRATKPT